jgi:hypothetical protein
MSHVQFSMDQRFTPVVTMENPSSSSWDKVLPLLVLTIYLSLVWILDMDLDVVQLTNLW